MKISSTKKAAILATVLGGFVLGHSAEAANLGVVTASDYATSHMGAVQGSLINSDDITVVKSVITDLNRDPAVYNTIDPVTGKSSLYIRQYNYSTTNLQNSYAFDAQGDWNNRAAGNTSKAVNAHDVVRYNNYVYVASYDEGTVGIAQVVQDENGTDKNILDLPTLAVNLKQDLIDYAGQTFNSKAQLHGEGVVIVDGNLYVIANVNPEGGYKPYNDSYLMKYVIQKDGSLKYDGYVTMGKNTDSVALNVYNNYILTTAIGGYQNYGAANSNAETSLNVATIHPEYNYLQTSREITLPENLTTIRDGETIPKSEFRSLKVMPNGTAYVMTYNIGTGGDNVDVTVYQTTVSNLLSKNPQNWTEVYKQEAAPGWFGRLDAEYNTKRLWVQVGNKLNIYTDGATTPISLGTSDIATSPLYNELYTWDIIGTDVIPEGNLVKLQLAEGVLATENDNYVSKEENGTNITAIKNQIIANISGTNPVIDLTTADEGNLTNNVLAGIYVEDTSSTVNANTGLQIQVENNIASPVGIYVGGDGSAKVNAANGNVNILTKTMDGGNSLTNAVWLDPTQVGGESLTIDAKATNITMEGGHGGNGVAIQKTDRWGENSKESALGGDITIKGDLNIKGEMSNDWGIGANPTNVLSRFNNAGILVDVNNSSVEVKGNVDMDVYGNGVTVNGKNATVTLAKGGTITVPTGTDYGYYTLAAYEGTINMNKSAGNNDVVLNGDIFAIKGATINLGLATADSKLNGIIDNGGTVNLTLKNGATWENVANNSRYYQDNEDVGSGYFDEDGYIGLSHVTTLKGGSSLSDAGVIVQSANSGLLKIDTLNGALKIEYSSYDADKPTNILGGDIHIGKAITGSQVALYTSNTKAIDTSNEEAVKDVLGTLANKLYYNEYIQGVENLDAVAVGIKEGVTSSSVEAKINFDKATGQGTLGGEISEGTTEEVPGDNDTSQDLAPAHPGGSTAVGVTWSDSAAYPNGLSYNEGTSSVKLSQSKTEQVQANAENGAAAIYVTDGASASITAGKNRKQYNLDIITNTTTVDGQANAVWVDPTAGGESLTFKVGAEKYNKINITMLGGAGGNGIAITKSDKDTASNASGSITFSNGSVYIKGSTADQWGIGYNPNATDARYNSSGILVDVADSTVSIANGSAYMDVCGNGITVDAKNAAVKIASTSAFKDSKISGSQVLVPEGSEEHKFYSLAAYEGSIYFDINDSTDFDSKRYTTSGIRLRGKIDGDMYIGGKDASIEAGFNGSEAYFNGAVINEGGTANLCLVDGATWTNVSTNGETGITSHISSFHGNTEAKKAVSQIVQTADSGDVVIDNYSGNTQVYYSYDESNPLDVKGGNVMIKSAAEGSSITLNTNYTTAIDWGNMEYVLDSLAQKLYYLGYIDGEENLSAYLKIGEGLTASSISTEALKVAEIIDSNNNISEYIDNVIYDIATSTLNAGIKFDPTTGRGGLLEGDNDTPAVDDGDIPDKDDIVVDSDFTNEDGAYTKPIYGTAAKDLNYIGVGVLNNNIYNFNEDIKFDIDNKSIDGGPYHRNISTAISVHGDLDDAGKVYSAIVNLNGHNVEIKNDSTKLGSGASISAINKGILHINNPGNITITENCIGPSAGIFANGGGEVYIHNSGDNVVKIDTTAGPSNNIQAYGTSGAGIKTMNGLEGARSKVVIDGLVDIVADLNKCNNECISAVASTIEVGGGNLQAINGAWAAIRAYGEFVTNNAAIVNVNVLKDTAGNITCAGDYKTTIYGDFVTNGGMGTLGYITVGLNGEDSYWTGNYADNRGYGVTKGQEGNVTLYMKDGAKWTGFSDGEMDVTMEGEGTTWYGFNIAERQPDDMGNVNGGLALTLKDGALWQNAISTEQKDSSGNAVTSKVNEFYGDGGYIDMTGAKTFLAVNEANHAEGSNGVSFRNSHIVEHEAYQHETGDLLINQYNGNTTIMYARDKENPTVILGGDTTIKAASKGSKITLSTDGYNILTNNQVAETLDNLANKLYYTAYVTGERNLDGKVQIAEGLTTASVGKYVGDIQFSTDDGQGSLKDGSLAKPGTSGGDNTGDNTQGGGTTGGEGEGTVTPDTPAEPEVPEQKPVVEESFESSLSNDNQNNSEENTYAGIYDADNNTFDFGKLDEGKAESEKVDIVKIEAAEKDGNNIVIGSNIADKPVVINLANKDLNVSGTASGDGAAATGIHADGANVEINNAGNVIIKANAANGTAAAIYAEGGKVTINNAANGGTVMLKAEGAADTGVAILHTGNDAEVAITGKVDITGTKGSVAVNVGKDSTVSLGGGRIGDKAEEGADNNTAIKVVKGGKVKINEKGEHDVVINGNIVFGAVEPTRMLRMMSLAAEDITVPETSTINLTTANSVHNGDVVFEGTTGESNGFTANISNGAKWNGNSRNGVALTVALDDGGVWTGYHDDSEGSALNLTINDGATWINTATDSTTVTSLSGEGGNIEMNENANADLTVEDYSGSTTFVYAHNYGADVEDDNLIKGGDVTIKEAAENSIVTMRTNNIGTSDKDEVDRVLKALAEKLAYTGYASNKDALTGKVQIMEGMTGSSVTREGQIKFDDTTGKGSLDNSKDVTIDYTGDYIYGDSETAMMKGAKSAMASTVMMWRSESNDILQRMGDLRLATEDSGVWAKYYGGKYEMDAQKTNFTTSYKAYQVGYDKAVGNGWNVGVAVSHNEGDSHYDLGGKGDTTVTSLSVYGNKDYGDGRYLGLIVKGSQLKNEYEVFNNDGYKLEGDYKTWGTSISAEYGKRIEKGNGFYFDPSVELTIGHVQGKDYTASSNMLAAYGMDSKMRVEQDDFNSIIGRIGFGVGQQMDKASYYAKLALAHEFGGSFDTHYTAEETKGTSIDFGDTWYEMQIGGTAKLSDNSLLYATYERSFGGDVTEKWRLDAGLRISF